MKLFHYFIYVIITPIYWLFYDILIFLVSGFYSKCANFILNKLGYERLSYNFDTNIWTILILSIFVTLYSIHRSLTKKGASQAGIGSVLVFAIFILVPLGYILGRWVLSAIGT